MATRRRSPIESWCGARSPACSMRTAESASATRARTASAAEAEVERPEGDVLGHRRHEELVVGVLEDEADPAAQLAQVAVRHVEAGDRAARRRRAAAR